MVERKRKREGEGEGEGEPALHVHHRRSGQVDVPPNENSYGIGFRRPPPPSAALRPPKVPPALSHPHPSPRQLSVAWSTDQSRVFWGCFGKRFFFFLSLLAKTEAGTRLAWLWPETIFFVHDSTFGSGVNGGHTVDAGHDNGDGIANPCRNIWSSGSTLWWRFGRKKLAFYSLKNGVFWLYT
jgi:hypothetical protein